MAAGLANIDVVHIEWQKFANTQIYERKQLQVTISQFDDDDVCSTKTKKGDAVTDTAVSLYKK